MMMRIKPIILKGQTQIDHAIHTIRTLPLEPVMEVSFRQAGSERNLIQNARCWAMLADISKQVEWHGKHLTSAEWKDVFTAALNRLKVVPGLDGGFVVIGGHTSKMSIKKMSEMIECLFAFGAEHQVKWTDPTQPNYE